MKKITINLVILFTYTLGINWLLNERQFVALILVLGFHVLILLSSIIYHRKNKEEFTLRLLSLGIVLIVGISACTVPQHYQQKPLPKDQETTRN